MKKIILFVAVFALFSCARYELSEPVVEPAYRSKIEPGIPSKEEMLVSGEIRVRVDEEMSARLEAATFDDGMVDLSLVGDISRALPVSDIRSMTRLFPYAGKHEARTREAGLHLWYLINYDENIPATSVSSALCPVKGVELIEYVPKIEILDDSPIVKIEHPESFPKSSKATDIFDDPGLSKQWNIYNDGSISGSVAGCDVNCIDVWTSHKPGNPNIVVAVVDEAIDYAHEDLADNMWCNPEMATADPSERCGYNSSTNSYKLGAGSEHATHIAGTIAAVNNNGKGICGIAGGDAKRGIEGVKLMSCVGMNARSIKWACDHGAVIATNSWAYGTSTTTTPASDREAIDYFIENARSEDGAIIGGLVFFPVRNDNSEDRTVPAAYEKCIAVAGISYNFKKASFSNYGPWVDVCAPAFSLYSTAPNNSYAYRSANSFCCPQAAGVAALLMANAKKGTRAEEIRERMETYVTDVYAYYKENKYLGVGLVNAALALPEYEPDPRPGTPTNFKAELRKSNYVDISVTVPSDEDDGKPATIIVYYSKEEFTSTYGIASRVFEVGDLEPGQTLEAGFTLPEYGCTYYLAASARDSGGLESELSDFQTVSTEPASAPVIIPLDGTAVTMRSHEKRTLRFTAMDSEGHIMDVSLSSARPELSVTPIEQHLNATGQMEGSFSMTIDALKADCGRYDSWILVGDELGCVDSVKVTYEILENRPPTVKEKMPDKLFNSDKEGAWQIRLSDYFDDPDGESLTYSAKLRQSSVVNASCFGDMLYVTPMFCGTEEITVTASDTRGLSCSQTIRVIVRDGSVPIDCYPNPVREKLNVRPGKMATVRVKVVSVLGEEVYSGETEIDPFSPLQIDFSGRPAGEYLLDAELEGRTYSRTIVKL